jgi:hypothetical protein
MQMDPVSVEMGLGARPQLKKKVSSLDALVEAGTIALKCSTC